MTTILPSGALNADLIGPNVSLSADICHLEITYLSWRSECENQRLWVSMNMNHCRFLLVELVSEYLKDIC